MNVEVFSRHRALRWPYIAAAVPALVLFTAAVLNVGPGYAPWALLIAAIVFGFTLMLLMPFSGRWPVAVGALGAFLLTFVLIAPVLCASQDHPPKTECSGIIPLPLPGHSGPRAPTYWSTLLVATLITGLYAVAAGRASRSR